MDELKNMELEETLKILKSLPLLDKAIETKLDDDLMKYKKSIEILRSQRYISSISTGDKWNAKNLVEKRESIPSTSNSEIRDYISLPSIEPLRNTRKTKPPNTIYDIQKNTSKYGLISSFSDTKASFMCDTICNKRETSPLSQQPPHRSKISSSKLLNPVPTKPPVVLDKFGCFRLALDEPQSQTTIGRSRSRSPPRLRSTRRSRSLSQRRFPRFYRSFRRSRSRFARYSKRSKSRLSRRRSRSLIRRRSRSLDGGHRRNSLRLRSYSRSLSRSPVRRGRRRVSPYRGNRYERRSSFTRNSGGYDNKGKDYRRDDSSDRRKKEIYGGIEGEWVRKKYEKSEWVEPESEQKKQDNDDEEQWDKNEITNVPTVEEINKIIDKAQEKRKEEILQRDKDLLTKQAPTNLPF